MDVQFEELSSTLSAKGAKCKFQFSTREQLYFEQECGFTDEELDIFKFRNRGLSVLEISFLMEDKYGKKIPGGQYSVSKVEARIRAIKKKMLKIIKDS